MCLVCKYTCMHVSQELQSDSNYELENRGAPARKSSQRLCDVYIDIYIYSSFMLTSSFLTRGCNMPPSMELQASLWVCS